MPLGPLAALLDCVECINDDRLPGTKVFLGAGGAESLAVTGSAGEGFVALGWPQLLPL